ncbi:hypothetical protein BC628DRAFT_1357907 [Trametes gibbosa]|nr:hypothetical protein BC628DRAFT_1357907 [Trametes gibbosa]
MNLRTHKSLSLTKGCCSLMLEPLSAVLLSENLQAGYELLERRRGSNDLKPI